MTKSYFLAATLMGATLLGGCADGLSPYNGSPDSVIATAYDKGRDTGLLPDGKGAIAYDPDGCQGWIIDDGVEGYSGRRYDPVSGLPICNGYYPPGTVIRDYQSGTQGIRDWVPGPGRRTVVSQ